jgi:hypothetical protein
VPEPRGAPLLGHDLPTAAASGCLLQDERRRQTLGNNRGVWFDRLPRLDVDRAHVDDPRELADAIEEETEVVVGAFRLQPVRNLRVERLLYDRRRSEALNRQIRLRGETVDAPQDVRDVLLLRQSLLQILETLLELRDLRFELRQAPRRIDAARDVGPKRGQPRLAELDIALHLGGVEVPEAVDRPEAHQDEGAYLTPPGKFAERQFHEYSASRLRYGFPPRPAGAAGACGSARIALTENLTRSAAFASVCSWLSMISTGR